MRTPFLFVAALSALFLARAGGQQSAPEIEVTDVRFDRVAGDWIVGSVAIRSGENPAPDARDSDFIDDVRLTFHICFEVDLENVEEEFSFYRSSVRMVSLEQRETYTLKFYLPGVVRERDDLDVDPFAWVVEMEAGGVPIPVREDQFDKSAIQSKEAFDSFLSKANSEGAANDGIFLPSYLAPANVVNESRLNYRELPAFYRFEPVN
ncbi:MAG: hypothetical protein ACLFRP_00815 [Puniceicoccaceae bacterium]